MNRDEERSATEIHAMRQSYERGVLDEANLPVAPIDLFAGWFAEASAHDEIAEPNVMTLSTAGVDGRPHARTVLLKEWDQHGLAFYTNFESAKVAEIEQGSSHVALTFLWLPLERQVRVEGVASRLSEGRSDAYFATRPRESQLGAWASRQSTVVAGRAALESRFEEASARFEGEDVPRPEFWGGIVVEPERFEFWQGRRGRMHDRIVYERVTASDEWRIERLMP